jgi:hypothetical protein
VTTKITLLLYTNSDALDVVVRRLTEMAQQLEGEAHDNDHERNKHVDKFRVRIGSDLLTHEQCEDLRKEAFSLRYFVRQLQG